MKQEKLQDALNLVDDDLLQEVEVLRRAPQKRMPRIWIRFGAIAACLCLLVGASIAAGVIWGRPESEEFLSAEGAGAVVTEGAFDGEGEAENETADMITEDAAEECFETSEGEKEKESAAGAAQRAEGVTIAPLAVDLCAHPDMIVDMEAFFIYQGRSYVYYGGLEDASHLKGELLGTATGLINEWTEEDGYVDLAGSVTGDFYAVNGFDPEFVLCMQRDEGMVEIYMNNNDLTLYTGADILVDRFQISGQFTAESISRERWFNSTGVPYGLDEEATEQVWALVEAMIDASFVYTEEIPLPENTNNLYETELYHLYLYLDNGMMVHLRLFDGGYVQIDGLRPVCLQVDEDVFWLTIKYLDQTEESLCGVPLMEDK